MIGSVAQVKSHFFLQKSPILHEGRRTLLGESWRCCAHRPAKVRRLLSRRGESRVLKVDDHWSRTLSASADRQRPVPDVFRVVKERLLVFPVDRSTGAGTISMKKRAGLKIVTVGCAHRYMLGPLRGWGLATPVARLSQAFGSGTTSVSRSPSLSPKAERNSCRRALVLKSHAGARRRSRRGRC